MGYTHKISWNEYEPMLGMFVAKSFRTTEDAVELHLASLKRREYDTAGDQNIASIKVIKI